VSEYERGLDVDGYSEVRIIMRIHNIGTDVPHPLPMPNERVWRAVSFTFHPSHPPHDTADAPPYPPPPPTPLQNKPFVSLLIDVEAKRRPRANAA